MYEPEKLSNLISNLLKDPPEWWNKQLHIWNTSPIDKAIQEDHCDNLQPTSQDQSDRDACSLE